MSVSPQVMQQMLAARSGGAPVTPQAGGPSPAAAAGPAAAPMAAPMAAPQAQQGKQAMTGVQVHIAMQILEKALMSAGSTSDEGSAILRALSGLSKTFGKRDSGDLAPAEIMSMVQGLSQQGGGTPVQRQLIQQMQRGNMPPQGAGAPQPGGPPPGQPQG